MAKNDENIQKATGNDPQADLAAARAAAMSQARARSMARAQTVARAQAMKKAQADERLRALLDDEGPVVAPPVEEVPQAVEPELMAEESGVEVPTEETVVEESLTTQAEDADAAEAEEKATELSEEKDEPEKDADEVEFAVQIRGLYKNYGKKQVLKGLDLDVYPGELFGFIGRNGVGKSTTIDCMIGAKRFDQGEISVGGYNIRTEALDAKYSYGYVASEPTCYEVMTGYDYLEFVASISYALMDQACPHYVVWYSKERNDIRRMRIDEEEAFYLFWDTYLREVSVTDKMLREEYRRKYRSEWYLHDVSINEKLELCKDGEFFYQLDGAKIKDECEKLEILL